MDGKRCKYDDDVMHQEQLVDNTNLFLIKRNTRRFMTNSTNINTPCILLQMSVSKKKLLCGDIKNEIISMLQFTPMTMNSRKKRRTLSLSWFNLFWFVELSPCDVTLLISCWTWRIFSAVITKNRIFMLQITQSGI